ncbi:MAG: hypothetical protein M1818_000578 [Claussenomyces sp. TS43310]|nr:MAG: hypothetical protein M1818_000578 [Claussenomyces sp. TS43310]
MAPNAAEEHQDSEDDRSEDQIAAWQKAFDYSHTEAMELIATQKANYSRQRVSDELWDLVRAEKEAQGWDRSVYEHELELATRTPSGVAATHQGRTLRAAQVRAVYVVKLDAALDTPEKIQEAAGAFSYGDDGEARFCHFDEVAKEKILDWPSAQQISCKPTFACIFGDARKDFSHDFIYPTLGRESTLPHFRARHDAWEFFPAQNQYPVWYFFYGSLAIRSVLCRRLDFPDPQQIVLKPASVVGGRMGTWAGKYRALIDGTSRIDGSAFQVVSEEQEDALRSYETDVYEVVRCTITMEGEEEEVEVQGCTFRFVDEEMILI